MKHVSTLIIKIKYNFYTWLLNILEKRYPPKDYIDDKGHVYLLHIKHKRLLWLYYKQDVYKWLYFESHFNTFESIYKKYWPYRPTITLKITPNKNTLK